MRKFSGIFFLKKTNFWEKVGFIGKNLDIQRLTPDQLAIYNTLKAKLSETESDNMLSGFLQQVAPPTPPHKSPSPVKSPRVVVASKTPKSPEKAKEETTITPQARKRKTRNDSNTTGRKGPG